jgi:hypothetical protein
MTFTTTTKAKPVVKGLKEAATQPSMPRDLTGEEKALMRDVTAEAGQPLDPFKTQVDPEWALTFIYGHSPTDEERQKLNKQLERYD